MKTTRTDASVSDFLASVEPPTRREDARRVTSLLAEVTEAEPTMYGSAIIGFGRAPYATADGRTQDWFAVGLSPRKAALTLYGLLDEATDDLRGRLGPHTTGKGCLYLKRLDSVDLDVLRDLVASAWRRHHQPD